MYLYHERTYHTKLTTHPEQYLRGISLGISLTVTISEVCFEYRGHALFGGDVFDYLCKLPRDSTMDMNMFSFNQSQSSKFYFSLHIVHLLD